MSDGNVALETGRRVEHSFNCTRRVCRIPLADARVFVVVVVVVLLLLLLLIIIIIISIITM